VEWQRIKGRELLTEASKNKETGEVTNEEVSVKRRLCVNSLSIMIMIIIMIIIIIIIIIINPFFFGWLVLVKQLFL